MTYIVGVHGIAQQFRGPEQLTDEWLAPMVDSVAQSGLRIKRAHLTNAFYGGVFREKGSTRGQTDGTDRSDDEHPDFEQLVGLLSQTVDRAGSPSSLQAALRALSKRPYFAGVAEKAFVGSLKQVVSYMNDAAVRDYAQTVVDSAVSHATKVIVAHSLGSVVAFEALHRFGGSEKWSNVHSLVTLGSPLGIPNLIFDRLRPGPNAGVGYSPDRISSWTNISDDGDVVALTKQLNPLFSGHIDDLRVDNGSKVHDISPYLSAPETGQAIAAALT